MSQSRARLGVTLSVRFSLLSTMSTIALLLYKREERNVLEMCRKKRPKQEVGEKNDSSNKGGGGSNLEFENWENKFCLV